MKKGTLNGKNIVLIGMPGAGKTTVGALLAKKLGRTFVDTDELVRKADGRELRDIVAQDGLEKFLEIQKAAIMQFKFEHCVIATGGGAVRSDELMQCLKKTGVVIYLRQAPDILEQRLAPGRRLARTEGQTFRELYEERDPLYIRYADRIIDCGEKAPEKIALEIINE